MGLLSRLITIASLLVSFSAQAGNLTEVYKLADQIYIGSQRTLHVLNPKLNADMYWDARAIQNLTAILQRIANRHDLQAMPPTMVGEIIVAELAIIGHSANHGYVSDTVGNPAYEKLEAENKFCKLSAEPCNLFSNEVSASICHSRPELANGLLSGN